MRVISKTDDNLNLSVRLINLDFQIDKSFLIYNVYLIVTLKNVPLGLIEILVHS